MDYEAKFRGKTGETSQARSHTSRNLHHNSKHIDLVINSTGQPQENRNFFTEVHCMKYRIRWENKNFVMGTLK